MDNIDIDINPTYTLSKRLPNGLYLSDEIIEILEEFDIDYLKCKNLKELIYIINEAYDETDDDGLYNILSVLSERDYYENYNK